MAYVDQQMSGNKVTALIIVAVLHVVIGYALVSGLASEAYEKVKAVTSAVNIEEEKPPEEPPPPPPPKDDTPPPPIVAPPPPISFNAPAPQVQTVNVAPPVALPPAPVALPPAPAAPPPPGFRRRVRLPRVTLVAGRRRTTIPHVHFAKSVKAQRVSVSRWEPTAR